MNSENDLSNGNLSYLPYSQNEQNDMYSFKWDEHKKIHKIGDPRSKGTEVHCSLIISNNKQMGAHIITIIKDTVRTKRKKVKFDHSQPKFTYILEVPISHEGTSKKQPKRQIIHHLVT